MNDWCEALGISVPSLAEAGHHREANTFARLIVALLERGAPMALEEVAARFEAAGIAPAHAALRSLKRCRPGRAPVYRDGDLYSLDPHDDELDLWVFRLGLRPPAVPPLRVVRPDPPPLPGPEQPLTLAELEEAFRDTWVANWSAQRLALAVLDAHGGRLTGARVIELLDRLTAQHRLRPDSAGHWRSGAIVVGADDDWAVNPAHAALPAARDAVRKLLGAERRRREQEPDPAVLGATQRLREAERKERAAELAGMRRVLVWPFPARRPEAVTLLDTGAREFTTLTGDELQDVPARLAEYDFIAAPDVRSLLRVLGFDPGTRRLADLGPPQKTVTLNRRGRTLKITLPLLIQGSCGISRPFGDPAALERYLGHGQTSKARRRFEADAKSLFALYQYARLHGAVRLRWGFIDEMLRAPWVDRTEPGLHDLMRSAFETGQLLEVVVGSAPGWKDPWSRAIRCRVVRAEWWFHLTGDDGWEIDPRDVQLARVVPL